jgi:L,D-transpeptidase catalytic domain
MRNASLALIGALVTLIVSGNAAAQQVELGGRSIVEIAPQLKPGEYVWAPDHSLEGPALVVVNLETQRLVLFRNGVPIAASTVSTGSPGRETPTGVFTILQKNKEHYSSTYNNAPMPNMQRLTRKGIALHAGKLPGFPASHGCIRLPHKFSALLFGATQLGMTVIITDIAAVPQVSETPDVAVQSVDSGQEPLARAAYEWNTEGVTDGVVSVVISVADQRALVMRDGVEIGSAPVRVSGQVDGAMAYVLRAWDNSGMHWLKVRFSGSGGAMEVGADEGKRFEAPTSFRHAIATNLRPGSVVIVTPEPLSAGSPGQGVTVLEDQASSR